MPIELMEGQGQTQEQPVSEETTSAEPTSAQEVPTGEEGEARETKESPKTKAVPYPRFQQVYGEKKELERALQEREEELRYLYWQMEQLKNQVQSPAQPVPQPETPPAPSSQETLPPELYELKSLIQDERAFQALVKAQSRLAEEKTKGLLEEIKTLKEELQKRQQEEEYESTVQNIYQEMATRLDKINEELKINEHPLGERISTLAVWEIQNWLAEREGDPIWENMPPFRKWQEFEVASRNIAQNILNEFNKHLASFIPVQKSEAVENASPGVGAGVGSAPQEVDENVKAFAEGKIPLHQAIRGIANSIKNSIGGG